MELLSNNSLPTQMASATSNTSAANGNQNGQATTAERLLAGILDSFPAWDLNGGIMDSNPRNE